MFTLPTDRTIQKPQPLPGKVPAPRFWNLKVCVTPGVMKNDIWYPNHQHPQFEGKNFGVEISVGDQVLINQGIKNSTLNLDSMIPDTIDRTPQTISIKIFGMEGEFNEIDFNALIHIDLQIENLPGQLLLEHHGRYLPDSGEVKMGSVFLGENGVLELPVVAPIYVWLLEQAQFIKSI